MSFPITRSHRWHTSVGFLVRKVANCEAEKSNAALRMRAVQCCSFSSIRKTLNCQQQDSICYPTSATRSKNHCLSWSKYRTYFKQSICMRKGCIGSSLATNKRSIKDGTKCQTGLLSGGKCKTRNLTSEKGDNQNENIFTVPNVLSLARISLAPVIGYYIFQLEYPTALVLLGLAGISDVLDGFIARNFKNQSTVFGSMLDPVADKVLMSVLTISLTCVSLLPVQLCALIIGRDIGLIFAVAYLRYKTLPAPLTFSRYFDFNLPTVQMKPTQISKYNTGLQLGLVGLCLAAPVVGFVDSYWLQAYWYLVGTTTVISGFSYVANKDTFKVIKQKRP